jgi:hypothetical protein
MPLGNELSTLATAWATKHYLVENLVFKDQTVNLDGYQSNCSADGALKINLGRHKSVWPP